MSKNFAVFGTNKQWIIHQYNIYIFKYINILGSNLTHYHQRYNNSLIWISILFARSVEATDLFAEGICHISTKEEVFGVQRFCVQHVE